MEFEYPPGATPLDPDEIVGLIPKHITTQAQLNDWESANIFEAMRWANKQKSDSFFEEGFLRKLHQKMFNQTWRWAGTFRSSNKNIGVDWPQIAMKIHDLLENGRYQLEHQIYELDELAVRFHHQLVLIHPFPNGNGRHARLMADILIMQSGQTRFSWGGARTTAASDIRQEYLAALRAADAGEIQPLLRFAQS